MPTTRRSVTKKFMLYLSIGLAANSKEETKNGKENLAGSLRPYRYSNEVLEKIHDSLQPGQEVPDEFMFFAPDNYQDKLEPESEVVESWAETVTVDGTDITDQGKMKELEYVSDQLLPPEDWNYTEEFLESKEGDCEEFANATYCILGREIDSLLDSKIVIGRYGEPGQSSTHVLTEFTVEEDGKEEVYLADRGPNGIMMKQRESYNEEYHWQPFFEFDENTPMRRHSKNHSNVHKREQQARYF